MNFDKLKNYLKIVRRDIVNGYSDNKNALKSRYNENSLERQEKNVSQFESSMKHYNRILKKYSHLAKTMELDNSLEICILFTYLLWNGYFSVNRKNYYDTKNLASIEGAFSFDVMTGKGVCLNFSAMLRDFLIECGYNSANLLNVDDSDKKVNYYLPVNRRRAKNKNSQERNSLIIKLKSKKYGNHVFTLIKEGSYIYAYDPTNLLLLNIKNINTAKLVNGKGTFKLKPYISYANNLPLESRKLLKRFYNMSKFENPYYEEYFKELSQELINYLNENKDILEKYYSLTLEDIKAVANTAEEYKENKNKRF